MTTLLLTLYTLCAIALGLYTAGQAILLWRYWRTRQEERPTPSLSQWPAVTVQLPLYNEAYVAGRLIDAVAAVEYPRDKLRIQVLDDSTDRTTQLVARKLAELESRGYRTQHLRRRNRDGFKAGALAAGVKQCDSEYIAILDADFIPRPISCGVCCRICWRTRPWVSCKAAGGISTPTRTA